MGLILIGAGFGMLTAIASYIVGSGISLLEALAIYWITGTAACVLNILLHMALPDRVPAVQRR